MLDIEDSFNKCRETVRIINEFDRENLSDNVKIFVDSLKVRCMEVVVLIDLIEKLQKKYPVISLDVALFLEGVQID